MKWLSTFKMLAPSRGALFLYGDITEDRIKNSDVSAESFLAELNAMGLPSDVDLHINSDGGSVQQGLAVYSGILQHPARFTAYIDGVAASMAGVIAMACDKVFIADVGMFMIHNPRGVAVGEAKDMRKTADIADTVRAGMITAYQRRVAMTEEELIAAMDATTYYTAQEAVDLGFADEIFQAQELAAHIKYDFQMTKQEGDMPTGKETESTEGQSPPVDIEKALALAQADWVKVEDDRLKMISAKFEKFPSQHKLLAKCLSDREITAEKAGDMLLATMAEGIESAAGTHAPKANIELGESEHDKFKAMAVNSILAKIGKEKPEQGNRLRNASLVDIIRASAEQNGRSFSASYDKSRVVKEMLAAGPTQTTSDFPILLEDAMHKVLLGGFNTVADTWTKFCDIGSVSDFRTHNRYRRGSIANLTGYNEAGEFDFGIIPDGEREQQQVDTKGKIVTLTREMMVNDDLSAFSSVIADLGRAASRSIESSVYSALALNTNLGPTLASDGKAIFHADHNNEAAAAAISPASLDAARQLMKRQTDVGSNDYLDITPAVLLCPTELRGAAVQALYSQGDPTTGNANSRKRNIVLDMIPEDNVCDTPRLSGTRWYLFADPQLDPVIEVAFLNGERNPQIEQEDYFNSAGVKYRIMHDWGIAGVGYRGAVMNDGA